MYGTKVEMAVMILPFQCSKPHHSVQCYKTLASTLAWFHFEDNLQSSFKLNIPNFCRCMKLHLFAFNDNHQFQLNSNILGINTQIKHDLHLPSTNLTLVQKGVLHTGSNMYNHLPVHINNLSNNTKHFKSALKNHLIDNTFYSLDKYYRLM